MTRTQGWKDDAHYGYRTIEKLPNPEPRNSIFALLLTRNLVLHRGKNEYKARKENEPWKDAGKRRGDRPLTSDDCQDFAEAVFKALCWLEANPKVIKDPTR